jgi:hypothetical protein
MPMLSKSKSLLNGLPGQRVASPAYPYPSCRT